MVHMHAIPATQAFCPAGQPRITYLTNTEVDTSGRIHAIHNHNDVTEIGLIYQGQGVHRIGGRTYHSVPGDIILYNTGVLHEDLSLEDGAPMCFFLCGVANLRIDGLTPGHIIGASENCVLKSNSCFDFLRCGFEMIETGLISGNAQTAAFAQGFLQSLLSVIAELRSRSVPHDTQSNDCSLAERMRSYIDQNYAAGFSLDDLAQVFHISRFHVSHVFTSAFGISPMQYRTRRRIGEAQSLLTGSNESITYIASAVGYDDPNRFSQMFTKTVGMSPRKYRDLSVCSHPFRRGG